MHRGLKGNDNILFLKMGIEKGCLALLMSFTIYDFIADFIFSLNTFVIFVYYLSILFMILSFICISSIYILSQL